MLATPTIEGQRVGSLLCGLKETRPTAPGATLRETFERDGYLYLPSALPRYVVDLARASVFDALGGMAEIRAPHALGLATGKSRRQSAGDLASFWKRLSTVGPVGVIPRSWHVRHLVDTVLGGPTIPHDFVYLRARSSSSATRLHCDAPYFAKFGTSIVTTWIALAEIRPLDGGLYLVEDRHASAARRLHGDNSRGGEISSEPVRFVRARNARIRSAHFKPGDMVIFHMWMPHGSFDNSARPRRVRLSLDLRHQLRQARRDTSFFGADPRGITGRGYAEMSSALPLDQQP